MPLNGSGGVTQPVGSIYPAVAQTLIESAKANASFADIYTILASALYKDGQQVATQRVAFAQGIQTDSVTEKTASAGVTLDSVLLKDGRIDTTQGADIVCAATINLETATGNVVDVTGSTGPVTAVTLSQGHWRIVRFTSTPTLTHGASLVLPGAADITAAAGDYALFIGYAAGVVRVWYQRASGAGVTTAPFSDTTAIVKGSSDPTKLLRIEADGITTGTTRVATAPDYDLRLGNLPAGIGPLPYSGATIPTGWLECDGSAVSRTTYAALFTAISTTWGVGDGSTTFNIPKMYGRVPIGAGTGTTTENVTASSGNGFTVASNNTKWITGMSVVLSALTGFTTTATAGPTYYAVRISATNVRLATTLTLAQNAAPDITISGTGTATLTHTYTARTLGEYGGEESHAMSITELLAHIHTEEENQVDGAAGSQQGGTPAAGNTSSTGGNAAMNIMQPFAVTKFIISY